MCGRYSSLRSRKEHENYFAAIADKELSFTQRYNAAPSQQLPVVIGQSKDHRIISMQWGYLPVLTKTISSQLRINTRLETLTANPTGDEFSISHRCIVSATGFYEWEKRGGEKTPYYFFSQEEAFLCFAGVWRNVITADQRKTNAFTIVTTQANTQVAAVHSRMPLILDSAGVRNWLNDVSLDPAPFDQLQGQSVALHSHPVSSAVNNPYHNDPSCIREVQLRQPCLL